MVTVEISHAVLTRDVLPVGAAWQGDGLGERLSGVDLKQDKRKLTVSLTFCHSSVTRSQWEGGGNCSGYVGKQRRRVACLKWRVSALNGCLAGEIGEIWDCGVVVPPAEVFVFFKICFCGVKTEGFISNV